MRTLSCCLALIMSVPLLAATPAKSKAVAAVPADKIKAAGAAIAKSAAPSEDAARSAAVSLLRAQPGYTSLDVDQLALLVMFQAAQEANHDLQEQMAAIKRKNADRKKMREANVAAKNAKDSVDETSQEDQLKLQMYMDRMTKADAARSNMLKKFSETSSEIVGNMK